MTNSERTPENAFREWLDANTVTQSVEFTQWQEDTIRQIFSAKAGDKLRHTIRAIHGFLEKYPEPLMYYRKKRRS